MLREESEVFLSKTDVFELGQDDVPWWWPSMHVSVTVCLGMKRPVLTAPDSGFKFAEMEISM